MKHITKALFIIAVLAASLSAQMQVEKLNRGLIAVRRSNNHYLSWRLLANEPYDVGFNVYRGSTKLNNEPITGATIYTDNNTGQDNIYTVRAVIGGVEQAPSVEAIRMTATDGNNAAYLHIDLQQPPNGSNGGIYTANDGSAGDLDGDGQYELIIKWNPSNAKDNSQDGITDNVIIDAYKLNGERLWRIDLGPNIRAGAHYTQFMVYDFDGCGKAEMIVKTAPGTKDATGNYIKTGPAKNADHSEIYRDTWGGGHIVDGPEFLTVFGADGKELETIDYWPGRGDPCKWGSNNCNANRVNRFNAAVAYLDGKRPSVVFQRGYYDVDGRMTLWALDWRDGKLTERWRFDTDSTGNGIYRNQGNHQLSVADVDNSGYHSIITGSAVIKYDGTGYHTSGLGHGDALHVAHMIKGHKTPQIFMPHENGTQMISLRHANNGDIIFVKHAPTAGDVGRGVAAPFAGGGWYFWSSAENSLFDINGNRVGGAPKSNTVDHKESNFLIWWDGDFAREFIMRERIESWNVATSSETRLLTAKDALTNDVNKKDPVLTADLFGDWREEVIWRVGNDAVRIWTTLMPTEHRLVTMMHDPTYRVAIAWQNSSYNQPPHPGYYIASDMDKLTEFPLNVAVVGDEGGATSIIDKAKRGQPGHSAMKIVNAGRGTIKINYAMKNSGAVRIDLFDIKGKRVKTLVNSSKEMGTHQTQFTTTGLAAGMYLVKLRTGGTVLQERVVVAR